MRFGIVRAYNLYHHSRLRGILCMYKISSSLIDMIFWYHFFFFFAIFWQLIWGKNLFKTYRVPLAFYDTDWTTRFVVIISFEARRATGGAPVCDLQLGLWPTRQPLLLSGGVFRLQNIPQLSGLWLAINHLSLRAVIPWMLVRGPIITKL